MVTEPSTKSNQKTQTTKEILTENVTPLHNIGGGYLEYKGGLYQKNALKELRPDLFGLEVDGQKGASSSFGTQFPKMASKGDIFVRVDVMPNRLFKFDGQKWIEVQKSQTSTYLYDQSYLNYLVDKIGKGEMDLDLLSETEKEMVEEFLRNQNT